MKYDIADFSPEEIEAIERSGRSSYLEYATTPGAWPGVVAPAIPLMRARPGACMPGLRPPEKRPSNLPYAPCTPRELAMLKASRHITQNNLRVIMGRSGNWVRTMRRRWDCTSTHLTSGNSEQELVEARNMWRNLSR
jgi:hypothetical protein